MALSESDREWIELHFDQAIRRVLEKALPRYSENCPPAQKLRRWRAFFVGIAIGVGLATGATGLTVAKLLGGL